MQAELRTVWERFTYSGLFKREYGLQLAASEAREPADRARLKARLGGATLEDKKVFGPLEPRLRGVDAVQSLIEVLRRRRDDQLVCRVLYDGATSPAPAAAPEGPFYVVLEETYEAFRGRLAAVALDADAWGELCGGALEGGVEGGGDTFGP